MSKNVWFTQFTLSESEKELFTMILAENKHLSESHYGEIYAWVKLSTRISAIGDLPTREDLRFVSEYRLLSNSLKLNPLSASAPKSDFAQIMAGASDE